MNTKTNAGDMLKPDLKRQPTLTGDEGAVLASLTAALNQPDLSGLPKVIPPGMEVVNAADVRTLAPAAPVAPAPAPAPAPVAPAAPAEVPTDYSRIFFTGRVRVGKDYVAQAAKCVIFGFADPLYALQELFFPGSSKDDPGAREFLQTVGQWGRGTVSKEYPLSVQRAMFGDLIRKLGSSLPSYIQWDTYGKNPDIWLNGALERVQASPEPRKAIVNCRFVNEHARLAGEGWTHMHIMCSPATWALRIRKHGGDPADPRFNDLSERLAAHFDSLVTKTISAQRVGPKIKCIWNDTTPPPSPRMWTLPEWLAHVEASTTLSEAEPMEGLPTSL